MNDRMYETGTAIDVRAFHVMPDMPPPEGERHAHDYRLDVVARRDGLDERGMVIDLDALDGALGGIAGAIDGARPRQGRRTGDGCAGSDGRGLRAVGARPADATAGTIAGPDLGRAGLGVPGRLRRLRRRAAGSGQLGIGGEATRSAPRNDQASCGVEGCTEGFDRQGRSAPARRRAKARTSIARRPRPGPGLGQAPTGNVLHLRTARRYRTASGRHG